MINNILILRVVYYEDVCYWCCCFKYLLNIAGTAGIIIYCLVSSRCHFSLVYMKYLIVCSLN